MSGMITFDAIRPYAGRVKVTASACVVSVIVHKGHIKLFRYDVIAFNVVMNCSCKLLCDIEVFVFLCKARDNHDQNLCLQAIICQSCKYVMLNTYKGLHIINDFIRRCMIPWKEI